MGNQEIERKFLVCGYDYKTQAVSHSHIQQGYILSSQGRTVRVRVRDDKAYLTIKGPAQEGHFGRYEFEKEISLEDAKELMKLCEPGIIDKTRYLVPCGKHTFEVDEFYGDNAGLVMAEVERHHSQRIPTHRIRVAPVVLARKSIHSPLLLPPVQLA